MDVGLKIKEIRKSLGLTQGEFAEKLFLTPDAVSSWERGVNMPALDTIKQVSETFRVPLGDIIGIPDTGQTFSGNPYHKMVLCKLYEYQLIAGTEELVRSLIYENLTMRFHKSHPMEGILTEHIMESIADLGRLGYLVRTKGDSYDVLQMTYDGEEKTKLCFAPDVEEDLYWGEYLYDSMPAGEIYQTLISNIRDGIPNPFLYQYEKDEFERFNNRERILEMAFGIWAVPDCMLYKNLIARSFYWDMRKINLLRMNPGHNGHNESAHQPQR